ncbi:MAG: UDP-N-acetylmuramoyl-tripeptide--D-alanyl-D-alanine ligase [Patescibacteria group bacterium]
MRKILQLKLKTLAKLILKKYQPTIIGITGSLGKTSAKEAVAAVLRDTVSVRMSEKNYNNEIGLPLTIIGASSAGRDIFGWLKVFARAGRLLFFKDKNYPRVLILEMGVDRPGDMEYLTAIAPPQIGIVTAVSYSHLEYFGELINIKKEKQVLIKKIEPEGTAILNYDNEATREMAADSRVRTLTYGLDEGADLRAQDIVYNGTKGNYEFNGLNFKLNYKGSVVPVFMDNVMSETAVYAALAAAAVGILFERNLVEIARSLKDFSLPAGRMKLLPGLKNSFIIDDTYNSSPEASGAALKTLGDFKIEEPALKYAVLGDMLELGAYTEEGHRLVGEKVARAGINCLIAVGERARDIVRGAAEAGLDDAVLFCFDRPEEAGKFLQNRIKAGDVILIKGSQGARMEKVVKEIMAEPERAKELLVRQGKEWE